MSSVKAALHTKIESMSEKEARQVMKIVRVLKSKKEASLTLKTLAVDPAFKISLKKNQNHFVLSGRFKAPAFPHLSFW